MDKKEIRKKTLQMRGKLCDEYRVKASEKICRHIAALEAYRQAEHILSYVSYKSEVDTKKILEMAWKDQKTVAVPKVLEKNGVMEFYEINSVEELSVGYQGIEEPDIADKTPVQPKQMQGPILMIMPGAAFDCQCNRIGYGGGFYDRYLNKHKGMIDTLAICYEIQIVDHIEAEELDVKPNRIITELRIIEK